MAAADVDTLARSLKAARSDLAAGRWRPALLRLLRCIAGDERLAPLLEARARRCLAGHLVCVWRTTTRHDADVRGRLAAWDDCDSWLSAS